MTKYEWLLFDADGTLFDFDRAAREALANSCRQVLGRYEPAFAPIYEGINRRIWHEFEAGRITQDQLRTRRFEQFFAALGVQADPALFSDIYLQSLAANTDLLAGAAETVKKLAAMAKLMIITNGLREVQRPRFEKTFLRGYFADFVISEEVGAAKPDREIFDAAFRLMGHPVRSQVLIVGDSLTSDMRGGHNYGLDTCWFNPAGRPCDQDVTVTYEITDLAALPGLVSPGCTPDQVSPQAAAGAQRESR